MRLERGIYRIKTRATNQQWGIIAVFHLMLWQSALQEISSVFRYVDEVIPLYGIIFFMYQTFWTGRIKIKKTSFKMILLIAGFVVTGLTGNALFQYQPLKYVLKDTYTNLKFYLCIISGHMILKDIRKETKESIAGHARFSAIVLFVMLVMDQTLHIFISPESRYGLRTSRLVYGHPTYLAGAMVYLLSVLTAFFQRKNIPYIGMALIVLFFTLRSKAIAGTAVYILLFYIILIYRKKLKLWHLAVMGTAVIWLAWDNYSYYYIELEGQSARSVLIQTSFQIMKDYFPIGTGFGTYGSAVAGEHYSPVYVKYGFLQVYELGGNDRQWGFFSDTFWPIIIGQTGFIGLICYVAVLALLALRILRLRKRNIYAYVMSLFIFAYVMISSTSEPAFNNSVTIPLAMMLGYAFSLEDQPPNKELAIK